MITLNTEKDLIRISTMEEMESRPGFLKDLNPQQHELKSIIATYRFKDKVPCGFSNCHTPHLKGYIITTKSGHETNIGHQCGKREFGVSFENLRRTFDRDLKEKEFRETLYKFNRNIENFTAEIELIRNEAGYFHKRCRELTHTGTLPNRLVNEVRRMIRDRSASIYVYRETSDTDRQLQKASFQSFDFSPKKNSVARYQSEKIGELKGIEALYPENDLRELLIKNLKYNLDELSELEVDHLNYRDLKKWSGWVGEAPVLLQKVKSSINKAKVCFVKENVRQLEAYLDDYSDEARFRNWVKDFPESSIDKVA